VGLFGLFKTAGEEIRADVKEWMGTTYFEAAVISGLGLVVEELTNSFMVTTLKLEDWKALAYKQFHRLVFSALYYFGGKALNKPVEALTASITPLALIVVDAISALMKGSPAQKGAELALSLWGSVASQSANITSAPVSSKETVEVTVSQPQQVISPEFAF